jgi:hypothetical protein
MGEAKRKRQVPCACGSQKPAITCCLTDRGWWKPAAVIKLKRQGHGLAHDRCYLKDTSGCSEKISGEHLVSENALRVLDDAGIYVGGFPWMEKGETKQIGFGALVANRLCEAHNSALSALDAAAGRLFRAVKDSDVKAHAGPQHFLISGHDIERWFLKTIAAFAASRNLSKNRQRLTGRWEGTVNLQQLLEDHTAWKPPLGLYFMNREGQKVARSDDLNIGPLTTVDKDEIAGVTMQVQGLWFGVLAVARPIAGTLLEQASYRPGSIIYNYGAWKSTIQFSWDDAKTHNDVVLLSAEYAKHLIKEDERGCGGL